MIFVFLDNNETPDQRDDLNPVQTIKTEKKLNLHWRKPVIREGSGGHYQKKSWFS